MTQQVLSASVAGVHYQVDRTALGVRVVGAAEVARRFDSLSAALQQMPELTTCSPGDEFTTTDEDALFEFLRPNLGAETFPGESFEIMVNGRVADVFLSDHGIESQEIASVEQVDGGIAVVLRRVGPWMACWYVDDQPSWGWRIDGEFDPEREIERFLEEVVLDLDLSGDVELQTGALDESAASRLRAAYGLTR